MPLAQSTYRPGGGGVGILYSCLPVVTCAWVGTLAVGR